MSEEARIVAAEIAETDAWLIPYLLGWAGLAEPQPWGAAMSFAMEVATGFRVIRGESDATPTELGRQVAALLKAAPPHPERTPER